MDIQLPELPNQKSNWRRVQTEAKRVSEQSNVEMAVKSQPWYSLNNFFFKNNQQIQIRVSRLARNSSRRFPGLYWLIDLSYLSPWPKTGKYLQKKLGSGKEPKSIASSSSTRALIKDRTRLHGRNHFDQKRKATTLFSSI